MKDQELLKQFGADMMRIYEETWKSLGSRSERFRQMIEPPKPGKSGKLYRGPLKTAKELIARSNPARLEGLRWLKDRGRIDLSVEHLVQSPKYRTLFTEEEIKQAHAILRSVR